MEEELKNTEEKTKNLQERGFLAYVLELVKIIAFSLAIIVPIRTFIFQPFFVQGASMEPNFHNGEYLIVNELGYKKTVIGTKEKELFTFSPSKKLERKEVIVFRNPQNTKEYFIKRVIGLPGEKIEIRDGDVYVFNEKNPEGVYLNETDYLNKMLHKTDCQSQCIFELGENEFLVLGDNRRYSSDSRSWGALDGDLIIGKVLLRAWPPEKISFFD